MNSSGSEQVWRLTTLKAGMLAGLALAAVWYGASLADIVRVTDGYSLRANGYRWYWAPDFLHLQRGAAGGFLLLVFTFAAMLWRSRSASPGRRWEQLSGTFTRSRLARLGAGISRAGVLFVVCWLTLCQLLGISRYDVFFLSLTTIPTALLWAATVWTPPAAVLETFRRLNLPALLLTSAAILGGSLYFTHDGHAIVTDAQSQIAQARLLLSGRFTIELSPELLRGVALPNFAHTTPTFAQYPPGHILLLLPFIAAGLPANYLNILCGIACVYFVFAVGRLLSNKETGIVAALLVMTSPLFMAMQSGAMNHGSATLLLMITSWAFLTCLLKHNYRYLWIGLCALSWVALTRPLNAVAHGAVWGPVLLGYFLRHTGAARQLWASLATHRWRTAVQFGAMMTPAIILLTYNYLTTGNPLLLGYTVSNKEMHRLGFTTTGPYPYLPVQAINNLISDGLSLSTNLFGFPFSSWILLLGWFIVTQFTTGELVLCALILSQTILYRFYHFYDLLMGPRFVSELVPFYAILAALGVVRMAAVFNRPWKKTARVAGAVLLVGSAAGGMLQWNGKLAIFTRKYTEMSAFLEALPTAAPKVIVVPEVYAETVGEHLFGKPPYTWFVYIDKQDQVETAPELQGYTWYCLPE